MARAAVHITPTNPPLLWSKLPEQIRRQLAVHLAPALRARMRARGEDNADADETFC